MTTVHGSGASVESGSRCRQTAYYAPGTLVGAINIPTGTSTPDDTSSTPSTDRVRRRVVRITDTPLHRPLLEGM